MPGPQGGSFAKSGGGGGFARSEKMKTAKSIMDANRQQYRENVEEEYLGPPPQGKNYIKCRMVLPPSHLPPGLHDLGTFNEVRTTHKVWIVQIHTNVFELSCATTLNLQRAVAAMNQTIHDLHLSNDHPPVRFIFQEPKRVAGSAKISASIQSRPHYSSKTPSFPTDASAMNKHIPGLANDLTASAESLTAITKDLSMRVNFGHLKLNQKIRGFPEKLPKGKFAKLMDQYSTRGGARLETRIPDVSKAEQIVRYLVDPKNGVLSEEDEARTRCELVLVLRDREMAFEISMDRDKPQLLMPTSTRPEEWGRLDWTVTAPDMSFDWNFRVDAYDKLRDTPPGFNAVQRRAIVSVNDICEPDVDFRFPSVSISGLNEVEKDIAHTRIKSSVILQYKDTPYSMEISVTKTWNRARTAADPDLTWGIELYAIHWEESMNYINPSTRRKDWGEDLENIWPGSDSSLEIRFGAFIRTILEVQSVLEGIGSKTSAPWQKASLVDI